jgi:threonine/homoserine/homoserine lactone efflux protein
VAYLLYLGVRAWRATPVDLTATEAEPRHARAIFLRGLLVSLANPKTLLFYGAFLPQFVALETGMGWQLAVLSATVLAIAALVDSGWALLAGRFRGVLAARGRLRNRLTGGFLIAAGVELASARRA